jgi:hypothetical protein
MIKKHIELLKQCYNQVNSLYNQYRYVILLLIIAAFCFQAANELVYLRNFYFNQEVFDLNMIPKGVVVWIYPKNKSLNALQPDSLKIKNLTTNITSLNYNVDIWIVAIHTTENKIIKIEVPDYSIDYFKIGSFVGY